ncbi:hypothetical protein FOA52_011249 [Chlamydomonas sp. UWO 241]|nr:hypothetical protein FOA52_011249 [Chlamydomonas sp. UWO 241]
MGTPPVSEPSRGSGAGDGDGPRARRQAQPQGKEVDGGDGAGGVMDSWAQSTLRRRMGGAAQAAALEQQQQQRQAGWPPGEQPPPQPTPSTYRLITDYSLATDRSHLNPVYRLIRKKELQHARPEVVLATGRQKRKIDRSSARSVAQQQAAANAQLAPPAATAAPPHADPSSPAPPGSRSDGNVPPAGQGQQQAGADSLIWDADMASEKSRLNPVYRLIRKAELQFRRRARGEESAEDAALRALRGPGPTVAEAAGWRREALLDAQADAGGSDTEGGGRSNGGEPAPPGRSSRFKKVAPAVDPDTMFGGACGGGASGGARARGSAMVQDSELANASARMNPVFRLIRKKELQARLGLGHGADGGGADAHHDAGLPAPASSGAGAGAGAVFRHGLQARSSGARTAGSGLGDVLGPRGEGAAAAAPPRAAPPPPGVDKAARVRSLLERERERNRVAARGGAVGGAVAEGAPGGAAGARGVVSAAAGGGAPPGGVPPGRAADLRRRLSLSSAAAAAVSVPKTAPASAAAPTRPAGWTPPPPPPPPPAHPHDAAALGVSGPGDKFWRLTVARRLKDEHMAALQQLQDEFPQLDVGNLLGISLSRAARNSRSVGRAAAGGGGSWTSGGSSSAAAAVARRIQGLILALSTLDVPQALTGV